MSWFLFGETRIKRGVWLRKESNPDVYDAIITSKLKPKTQSIVRIVVDSYDKKTNNVILEVWCQKIKDVMKLREIYTVFYITLPMNSDWVCEGDLGRGFTKKKD